MNARYAFWAKGLLLVSGTGLLVNGAATLIAQTGFDRAAQTPVKELATGVRLTAGEVESLTRIQKALRDRYRRDGLETPPMLLSPLPKTTGDAKQGARNRSLRKPGLLSRILPGSSTIHQTANPNIHWPSRLTNWSKKLHRIPRHVQKKSTRKLIVQEREQPQPLPEMRHRAETKQDAVPPVPGPIAGRQPENNEPKIVPSVTAKEISKPQNETDDGLTNPFTDLSEADADRKTQGPSTGLKPKGSPTTDKQVPVFTQKSRSADSAAPPLPDLADADITQTTAETGRPDKLHKAAEQPDRSGLEGFCPVVLRDQRGLVDAKAELSSTYKSRRYHFSSAAAKANFDEHPEKYAPVAAGQDVVRLANHGDRVDGSLDYAVWFRNRLYLFSTARSLRTFTIAPADYAVTESH